MDVEIQSILYILLLFAIVWAAEKIFRRIIKNEKIRLIISNLLMLGGAVYVSFFLLKDKDFLLKEPFPLICLFFLIDSVFRGLFSNKADDKIEQIFKEEEEWKEKTFGNK